MKTLPYAPSLFQTFWSDIANFPFAVLGTVLFAIILHRLANQFRCYGLPKNLVFGVITGTLAFALVQLYGFLSRNYGFRSLILGEFRGWL